MEPLKKLSEWENLLGNQEDFGTYMRNYELRSEHISKCGFPIVTEELVSVLTSWIADRPVIDVGCGTGYLAYHLLSNNVNVTAVDNFSTQYLHGTFFRSSNFIIQGDALEYIKPNQVIIMSWPDYEAPFAYNVAKKMVVGQYLIYQGEGYGGCTGNDDFHEVLTANFEIQQEITDDLEACHLRFFGIHDYWEVYKKISVMP